MKEFETSEGILFFKKERKNQVQEIIKKLESE